MHDVVVCVQHHFFTFRGEQCVLRWICAMICAWRRIQVCWSVYAEYVSLTFFIIDLEQLATHIKSSSHGNVVCEFRRLISFGLDKKVHCRNTIKTKELPVTYTGKETRASWMFFSKTMDRLKSLCPIMS